MSKIKPLLLIPVYQHGETLGTTLKLLSVMRLPMMVINDGSDARHAQMIRDACRLCSDTVLLDKSVNEGKGAAVVTGLREALKGGYTHVFQIDADGQHDLQSADSFLAQARQHPEALILGYPVFDETLPFARKLGRWITHIWVWINTLSLSVRDSMCGFRIYPAAVIMRLIDDTHYIGNRMEFDTEICVRACWGAIPIVNFPVRVSYPKNGYSNFRIVKDNMRITVMHARLFFGMLYRAPVLLMRRMSIARSIW